VPESRRSPHSSGAAVTGPDERRAQAEVERLLALADEPDAVGWLVSAAWSRNAELVGPSARGLASCAAAIWGARVDVMVAACAALATGPDWSEVEGSMKVG
jgi:hypothetical protein